MSSNPIGYEFIHQAKMFCKPNGKWVVKSNFSSQEYDTKIEAQEALFRSPVIRVPVYPDDKMPKVASYNRTPVVNKRQSSGNSSIPPVKSVPSPMYQPPTTGYKAPVPQHNPIRKNGMQWFNENHLNRETHRTKKEECDVLSVSTVPDYNDKQENSEDEEDCEESILARSMLFSDIPKPACDIPKPACDTVKQPVSKRSHFTPIIRENPVTKKYDVIGRFRTYSFDTLQEATLGYLAMSVDHYDYSDDVSSDKEEHTPKYHFDHKPRREPMCEPRRNPLRNPRHILTREPKRGISIEPSVKYDPVGVDGKHWFIEGRWNTKWYSTKEEANLDRLSFSTGYFD